jgi:hypothetical protein
MVLFGTRLVDSQGEIISISSYNLCFNIDNSATGNSSVPGNEVFSYINCSGGTGPSIPVTTLNLRLSASATNPSIFEFQMTVVPPNTTFRQNKNPQACAGSDSSAQNCILTTPANISIVSTKYVYYYNLKRVSSFIPQYCFVTNFETYTTQQLDLEHDQYDYGTNPTQKESCEFNVYMNKCSTGPPNPCAAQEEMFADPNGIATGNFGTTSWKKYYYANKKSSSKATGECVNTMFSFDSIRRTNTTTTYGVPFVPEDYYQVDTSMPTCDPVPESLLRKTSTPGYNNVLQSLECSGFNCPGYVGYCYTGPLNSSSFVSTDFAAYNQGAVYNSSKGTQATLASLISTFSLGPECVLYEIDEVPGVAVKVVIDVTVPINSSDPNSPTRTQRTTVSNLDGMTKVSADDGSGMIGVRIISVDTLNGYLGASIPGYIIQCGGSAEFGANLAETGYDDTSDPRNSQRSSMDSPNVSIKDSTLVMNTFIDMVKYVQSPDQEYDPTWNPWSEIEVHANCTKNNMYPRGCYMGYNPNNYTQRNAMWYYLPITAIDEIGRGCNQLGFTDLYLNNPRVSVGGAPTSTTGLEMCSLPPFACTPGIASKTYGGRSVPGCLASAAFVAMDLNQTAQMKLNGDRAKHIAFRSMPKTYNPKKPNMWTTILDGVGPVLMHEPYINGVGTSPITPPVNFELLLDIVATFVAYESEVPNGQINNISCFTGDNNNTPGNVGYTGGYISVENTGSINGSYAVQFSCPNNDIVILPEILIFGDVAAYGGKATMPFQFQSAVNPNLIYDPPPGYQCTVFLLPNGGDVFAVLDTVQFSCNYAHQFVFNGTSPIGNISFTPPPPSYPECKMCDFSCYKRNGQSSKDSPCYWIIVAPFLVSILLLTVSFILYTIIYCRRRHNSKKYVDFINAKGAMTGKQHVSKVPT